MIDPFLAELAKRERGAVQAFAAFLETIPQWMHLTDASESKRAAAVAAAHSLDEHLALGEHLMGVTGA